MDKGAERERSAPIGIEDSEDASAEVVEVPIAESDALYDFDTVVAALGKAVGIRAVKGVEDIGLPVSQHGQDGLKLGQVSQSGIHPKSS